MSRLLQEDLSSIPSSDYSVEDHIYEEIAEVESDNDDTATDDEDNPLFTLISSGRRKNLRYFGSTSWDFETERI